MTTIVQFESDNWYAEGVAVMDDELYSHPQMTDVLDQIAKDFGFEREVGFEREFDYDALHHFADNGLT